MMTEQPYTLQPCDRGKALTLLANAYDSAALNGTAERIRRGVVLSADLIALAAIKAALDERGDRRAPVDPDLIEARKIAADHCQCRDDAEAFLSGEQDESITIPIVLAAIKRGRDLATSS